MNMTTKSVLKSITQSEVDKMIRSHELWLNSEPSGERAVFDRLNLNSIIFKNSNLRLSSYMLCDLSNADFSYSDVTGASFSSSIFCNTNLKRARFGSTELRGSNLLLFQFQRETAYFNFDGILTIGDSAKSVDEWLIYFEEYSIKNHYTSLQSEIYFSLINVISKILKAGKFVAEMGE